MIDKEELQKQRNKYNRNLLQVLKKYLRENPQLRFTQALHVLSIIDSCDRFHEEPKVTYTRVLNTLQRQKEMKLRMEQNNNSPVSNETENKD